MKTNPIRPGSCLWVVAFFVAPALFGTICAPCVTSVFDLPSLSMLPAALSIESDEGPDQTRRSAASSVMEPLRPFDEGFDVMPE